MISIGIDLAGSEKNPTGFAILKANESDIWQNAINKITVKNVFTNQEIIDEIKNIEQARMLSILAIDAPFSAPQKPPWRSSELQLLVRGFKPISSAFPSMHMLTLRTIKLIQLIKSHTDAKIIETFSKAVDKILAIDRNEFLERMMQQERLEKIGKWQRGKINKDQYDAMLCAICGLLHMQNKTEILGSANPYDQIVLPRLDE